MKLEVTERDKAMLPILAVLGIVAAYVCLGIWPLHRANVQMRAQLEMVREDMGEKQKKLDGLPIVRIENESLKADLGRLQAPFYPMLESQEIGKLLTAMALEHGLSVRKLEIRMPSASPALYAFDTEKEEQEPAKGAADSVSCAQVRLEVTGPKEGRDGLWDALAYEEEGIRTVTMRRITARSMNAGDGPVFEAGEDSPLPVVGKEEGEDVLELQLEISMCHKEGTG